MDGEESLDNTLETVGCLAFSDGGFHEDKQDVCTEDIVVISLNGRPIITQVATRTQLEELGAGFIISQGYATHIEEVRVEGLTIQVSAPQRVEAVRSIIESCGGATSDILISPVKSSLVIGKDLIFTVISHIVSGLWEKTGGAHCSVLFSEGRLVAKSSDIGRHNTVDKVIGYATLNGVDLSKCVLGCTGRQPLGMITKAANAGIPIVVSKAATTSKGIEQAKKAGITLIGRVKPGSFCVYSHPERIEGLGAGSMDRMIHER
jgi:FdhD protein